jgi:alkaline phosphatase
VNKDTVKIKSIAYDLQEDGYNIGIISNVGINHATPASFYASTDNRNNYYEISRQIPKTGFKFFAGAGFIDFNGRKGDKEATDLYIERNGYTVSYGIEEFKNETAGKDKAIFCQASNRKESADNYVSDSKEVEDAKLAEMLKLGLEFIGNEEPFFFMCEGGTIDWSCHDNRTMSMVNDVIEFDNAIRVAYDFYLKHKDETLIVVTADHETGGITLGCGRNTIKWNELEEEWIGSGRKNMLDSEANRQFNEDCSIGWTTSAHTGGPVPVYAIGKGAEKFTGRIDNTDIKGKILGE